jgi:hypothetical protein
LELAIRVFAKNKFKEESWGTRQRVAARVVEDRSSESLAVNQFPAVVPPTIDTA